MKRAGTPVSALFGMGGRSGARLYSRRLTRLRREGSWGRRALALGPKGSIRDRLTPPGRVKEALINS